MAIVFCKKTGWPMRRSFRRGYRLNEDRCEVCGDKLIRKPPHHEQSRLGECPSHDCCGKHTPGVDEGIVDERRWNATSFYPKPEHHYHKVRRFRCPVCGETWTSGEQHWSEPIPI